MGIINLYRVTAGGDTLTVNDRIDFNLTTQIGQRTDIENAFITKMSNFPTDGVGNNQGAEAPTGDQSALGSVEEILTIDGYISKRNGDNDDGNNTFLATLKLWETDGKEIDGTWELGRMGIDIADNHNADLIPVRTGSDQIAYLWEKIEYVTDFKGNREMFTLYLRVNRGDGT